MPKRQTCNSSFQSSFPIKMSKSILHEKVYFINTSRGHVQSIKKITTRKISPLCKQIFVPEKLSLLHSI